MKKKIHIVSFDVPYPADYGGVIDVFNRIKIFHELGVEIILHCFEYGRGKQPELEKYCKEVHYYKRKKRMRDFFHTLPFIVNTRKNNELVRRLLSDEHPVWLEGLHCCGHLKRLIEAGKKVYVRTHNIEHDYYAGLAEQSFGWRKRYFTAEAKKLKRFESVLKYASCLFCVKPEDRDYFEKLNDNVHLLYPALESNSVCVNKSLNKVGYALFHGNLSVAENEVAVYWLLEALKNSTDEIRKKIIISGKNPAEKLQQLILKSGLKLIANPDENEMKELIGNAKIHLLYTSQNTGIKLKLLHALQTDKAILCNSLMVKGTDLEKYCFVEDDPSCYIKRLTDLLDESLSPDLTASRKELRNGILNSKESHRQVFEDWFSGDN